MVVEELWTAYKNPSTAVLMGHARGVLCLAGGENGVAVHTLAHSLVKRALVGSGSARKEQVKKMVVQLLGLRRLPNRTTYPTRLHWPSPMRYGTERAFADVFEDHRNGRRAQRRSCRASKPAGSVTISSCRRASPDKVPSSNGAPVTLEVYSHLQMDGNAGRFTYFGFTNAIEREFFEALALGREHRTEIGGAGLRAADGAHRTRNR